LSRAGQRVARGGARPLPGRRRVTAVANRVGPSPRPAPPCRRASVVSRQRRCPPRPSRRWPPDCPCAARPMKRRARRRGGARGTRSVRCGTPTSGATSRDRAFADRHLACSRWPWAGSRNRIPCSPWLLRRGRVRGQHLHPAACPVAGVLPTASRRRGLYRDAERCSGAAGDRPRARHRAGVVEVWHLVVIAVWLGLVSAFDVPLRQTLYVHLVDDRADLPNAIALNSFMVNAAPRDRPPRVAGVLLAVVSEAVCFALNAVVVRRRARRARQRALAAAGGRARMGGWLDKLARGLRATRSASCRCARICCWSPSRPGRSRLIRR